jgi:inosine/xanthosine triphosphate pyrophosphatase family protein
MSFARAVIVTGNPAKAAALKRVASALDLRCIEVVRVAVDERGESFAENAALKALTGSVARPGSLALASDGGLVIPGLGARWHPLRTARFAGDVAPALKAEALLALLAGSDRRARWEEGVALARDGALLASWTEPGRWSHVAEHADLSRAPFWVDALLVPDGPGADHWERLTSRFAEFVRGLPCPA